jgi:uncharacterized protein YegP (UPF0339 family)
MLKIIATKNVNGAWYWRIVGGNGEIMANSEAYSSKGACVKSAKLVSVAGGFEFAIGVFISNRRIGF